MCAWRKSSGEIVKSRIKNQECKMYLWIFTAMQSELHFHRFRGYDSVSSLSYTATDITRTPFRPIVIVPFSFYKYLHEIHKIFCAFFRRLFFCSFFSNRVHIKNCHSFPSKLVIYEIYSHSRLCSSATCKFIGFAHFVYVFFCYFFHSIFCRLHFFCSLFTFRKWNEFHGNRH